MRQLGRALQIQPLLQVGPEGRVVFGNAVQDRSFLSAPTIGSKLWASPQGVAQFFVSFLTGLEEGRYGLRELNRSDLLIRKSFSELELQEPLG